MLCACWLCCCCCYCVCLPPIKVVFRKLCSMVPKLHFEVARDVLFDSVATVLSRLNSDNNHSNNNNISNNISSNNNSNNDNNSGAVGESLICSAQNLHAMLLFHCASRRPLSPTRTSLMLQSGNIYQIICEISANHINTLLHTDIQSDLQLVNFSEVIPICPLLTPQILPET